MNIIDNTINLRLKLSYIRRFILKYNNEYVLDGLNPHNIYLRENPEESIMCKHYLYLIQLDNDSRMIDVLKTKYGTPPKDGFIYCRNCGEMICEEDYSILEGLSDDKPVSTRAKMDTDEESIIEKAELNEEQKMKLGIINIICNMIKVKLSDEDILEVIYFQESINGNELLDTRYNMSDTLKYHPDIQAVLEKYSKDKLKVLRKQGKKVFNAAIRDKKTKTNSVKSVFKYVNIILAIIVKIFITLQTSIETYTLSENADINLLDFTPLIDVDFKTIWNFDDLIVVNEGALTFLIESLETITAVKSTSGKYAENTADNPWNFMGKFLKDKKVAISDHIFNTLKEFFKYFSIKDKILEKIEYNKQETTRKYLKAKWSSFKPLETNNTISGINRVLDVFYKETLIDERATNTRIVKKNSRGDELLENICCITSIGENQDKYITLKIPIVIQYKLRNMMDLENYTKYLVGGDTLKVNKANTRVFYLLLNNIVNSFYGKPEYKGLAPEIEKEFQKSGWKHDLDKCKFTNGGLRDLGFELNINTFRFTLEDHQTYINNNNINPFTLVINSPGNVRKYPYVIHPVIPESLSKEQIDILYKQFCYIEILKEDGGKERKIIKRIDNSVFYNSLLLEHGHLTIDSSICKNFSGPSEYMDILEEKQLMNRVNRSSREASVDLLDNDREFMRRCNSFISGNDFFRKEDVGNDILRDIHELNQKILDGDEMTPKMEEAMEILYNNILLGEDDLKNEIRENFPEEYHKDLDKYIADLLDDRFDNMNINSRILINYINSGIKVVLCRLKNTLNTEGGSINNKIPKEWKLTEDKKKIISTYLKNYEFSQYTVKKPRKIHKDKLKLHGDNSLYKYMNICMTNGSMTRVYSRLYGEIAGYIKNLNVLVGHSDSRDPGGPKSFSGNYAYYIVKHIFLLVLLKLSKFIQTDDVDIDRIIDDSKDIYPLFHINAETDTDSPKITIISKLIFDMIFNIYLENNENENIGLYYDEDLLSEKITKEREREKISVVDKLTNMDHEKRGIEMQMQEFGIKNIYKGKEAENLEWIQTDAYQEFRMTERDKLYGDASLLDPEAHEDIIGEMEMEAEAHVVRKEATDNMEDVDADDGYDNTNYADDELEA